MLRLIRTELLKLKGSYMVLIGVAGSATVPFLTFMVSLLHERQNHEVQAMEPYFRQALIFDALLIGFMLYGLIISFVFNREFQEDTMKSILPVPVGRIRLICAKLAVVLAWVLVLMLFTVALMVGFGCLGGFTGLTTALLLNYTGRFLATGVLFLFLATPVIFMSLLFRSYIPGIAFTIVVTIGNVMIMSSDYAVFYPWTAAAGIVLWDFMESPYPIWIAWVTVGATAVLSLSASFLFFSRRDIQ